MTLIRCPFPPTELRPNFRDKNHWGKWRPKAKAYGRDVWYLCMEQNIHKVEWPQSDIHLTYTFYAPKGCRWDQDAMESAFKWGQDAIAKTMRVDDKHFRAKKEHARSSGEGCVLVQIHTESLQYVPIVGSIS